MKIVYISNCPECPFADMDLDETDVPGDPYCTHPYTNIYRKGYVEHLIPQEGIREDCPLEEKA
jgi:hypothetical protein